MSELRPFLTAHWRYLAMINYEIDPDVLAPYVPYGTELDSWGGRTFVSVVGFLFLQTKVLGVAVPFHRNFEELNLRFYVRRKAEDGWRRGVVFIKELVPRFAIAAVARLLYGERYVATTMWHDIERQGDGLRPGGRVTYGFRYGGAWHRLTARTEGTPAPIASGSEEEFITEHYWGYASRGPGKCTEYQVEHPKWQVWQVSEASFSCDVAALYGPEFAPYLAEQPRSAFVADGSPVIVYQGHSVT